MARIRPRHAKQLLELLRSRRHPAMRGAEVGVFRGATSRVLLAHMPELHLYMVDAWRTALEDSVYYRSSESLKAVVSIGG